MKIKNKARLVARAEHHRKVDVQFVGDIFVSDESGASGRLRKGAPTLEAVA